MAISLVSSGNGFNLMSVPIYKYICGSELATIVFKTDDLPSDVKTIYSEVCAFGGNIFLDGGGGGYMHIMYCVQI